VRGFFTNVGFTSGAAYQNVHINGLVLEGSNIYFYAVRGLQIEGLVCRNDDVRNASSNATLWGCQNFKVDATFEDGSSISLRRDSRTGPCQNGVIEGNIPFIFLYSVEQVRIHAQWDTEINVNVLGWIQIIPEASQTIDHVVLDTCCFRNSIGSSNVNFFKNDADVAFGTIVFKNCRYVSDQGDVSAAALTDRILDFGSAGSNVLIDGFEVRKAGTDADPVSLLQADGSQAIEVKNVTMYRASGAGLTSVYTAATAAAVKDTIVVSECRGVVGTAWYDLRDDTISPAELTADTNNWSPTALFKSTTVRASTDASRRLTGMDAAAFNLYPRKEIWNVGSNDLVLGDQDTNSTDVNRFAIAGGDFTIVAGDTATLEYDFTAQRIRVV
jgi:hypothetical protein